MRRILLFAIFLSLSLFLFSKPTHAETVIGTFSDIQDYCDSRSGNVMNLETWYSGKCPDENFLQQILEQVVGGDTGALQGGEYRGFSDIVLLDFMTKFVPENPLAFVGLNSLRSDAAIPSLSRLLATTITTPPASGVNYLAHINQNMQNARLVKPAYAQAPGAGFGFNKLLPILPAWQGVRNIAYTLFILIFVIYGFMIMFRAKINPQTVINFQLAIPKLVVTLLAITFSYAIAGFIIDLSLLIPAFIAKVMAEAGIINLNFEIPILEMFTRNVPDLKFDTSLGDPVKIITGQGLFGGGLLGLQVLYELFFVSGVSEIVSLFTGLPTILVGVFFYYTRLGLIIKIILMLAFFYVLIKIAFMVMQSYVMIVVNIIFAPVILLGNVLPGSQSFGNWIRNLLANISIFPTVILAFMFAISFLGSSSPINSGDMWVPPYMSGSGSITVFGQEISFNSAQGIGALLAYGIIFITPKIADMVRDALKVPAFKYGSAIGEALSKGAGTPARYYAGAREAYKAGGTGDYLKALDAIIKTVKG